MSDINACPNYADSEDAPIKKEYIISEPERVITLDFVSEKDKKALTSSDSIENNPEKPDSDPAPKRRRLSKQEKKLLKGQNKGRPPPYKPSKEISLCNSLVDVAEGEEEPKCSLEKCTCMHDVTEYLKIKPPDIGNECHLFMTKGRCPRGRTCRFSSGHLTKDGKNIVNSDKVKEFQSSVQKNQVINILDTKLLFDLRKRKCCFRRSEKSFEKYGQRGEDKWGKKYGELFQENKTSSGAVTDEDIVKCRKQEKKQIDWKEKLYLAPLTTVGNLPFRRVCKTFGVDITCGEMALATSLLQGLKQEWALIKRHSSEDLFGVQLCGNNQYVMTRCAQLLDDQFDVDFVDINLGCPIELIYQQGAGSGLLRREHVLQSVIRCMNDVLSVPLTVKTRTGIYSDKSIAHLLAPKFASWGASLITVHGRSREQRYTKLSDWPYVEECAKAAAPTPVFGSGDILSYEDYEHVRLNFPTIAGVMIGRGALIKPWIFTEIKERRHWDISSQERLDILKQYVNYGLEHWGSDTKGVENTRRFLLEWLSFLHRYIPVGLLERLPQRMNQRPPCYQGRNELETLMASSNCADWIKISELLLGPVPNGFSFLPKHKANSWK